MKSYRFLAWKELLAQRVTSGFILIAVILSTITTTVIGQSIGILGAMREQQAIAMNGGRYAAFRQMSEEQLSELKKDSRLCHVGPTISIGTVDVTDQVTLNLVEYGDRSLDEYPAVSQIQEGHLPEKAMEIALPEDVLEYLGFTGKVGDTITLPVSKYLRHDIEPEMEYTADFILTGITKSNYIGYIYGGLTTGIAGNGTARELLPEEYFYYDVDFRTVDKRHFQDTVNDLAEKMQMDETDIFYNRYYLEACGIRFESGENEESGGSGFSFMTAAGVVTGAMILFMAGLVIYNILKITVSKRVREYGILRAMGSEKGQLYQIVFSQIWILCAAGIPVGMIMGILSVRGILTMATSFLSPQIFFAQNEAELRELILQNGSGKPLFLVMSAMITLLFALAAAIPAARYAAKTAPIAVISGQNIRVKRKNRKTGRIRNFEAYYARLNLKRSRSRTAITILSLAMSISVFIALNSYTAFLDFVNGRELYYNGDYSIVNKNVGFSADDLGKLERNPDVGSVAAVQFTLYDIDDAGGVAGIEVGFEIHPPERFQMVGLNDAYWDYLAGSGMLEENKVSAGKEMTEGNEMSVDGGISEDDLHILKSGKGCVVKNPPRLGDGNKELERTIFEAGEMISVGGKEIPVVATLEGYNCVSAGNDGYTHGVQMIVSDSLYKELTGSAVYSEMCPALKEDADRELFRGSLEELRQKIPGTSYLSYEDAEAQMTESLGQIRLLAWGLIVFIGLIGILNIVNTVYTNIHARVMEIGIQRAIGMSEGSIYETFLWEGAYYGIAAAVIGSLIGYGCTILVDAAVTGNLGLAAVPVVPIVEAAVVSVGACLAATGIPLRKIAGIRIVESMNWIE